MQTGERASELVGRDPQLARVTARLASLGEGTRPTVLVAGEAGIGKTSLIRAALDASAQEALVAWGASIDADGAPGFWPWTQAFESLVRTIGLEVARQAAGDDLGPLAALIPAFGAPPQSEPSAQDRLRLMDAVSRFLDGLAHERPIIVVIDDLQWADESSMSLFEFLARAPGHGAVALIGAYRHDELPDAVRSRLGDLTSRAEHVELAGLDGPSVAALVEQLGGGPVEPERAVAIHERTGGHPFFVRELALLDGEERVGQIPVAVRDAVDRRISRLSAPTIGVLEALAVLGPSWLPDVVAAALGVTIAEVDAAAVEAAQARVLTRRVAGFGFAHDLLRESVDARVTGPRRTSLHQALGAALEARRERGGDVSSADLARHFVAAIPVDGPTRAIDWTMGAAGDDVGALAFSEAADRLRRLRAALVDAAATVSDRQLVDVLAAEADAHARAGNPVEARGLLRHAEDLAERARDAVRVAQVALATAALGATFAARRDDIVRQLDRARTLVEGVDDAWEARVAATLARELQHSVPEDRPRAAPLSEHALEVGRRAGDGATLLTCLLARHDVLWTPGTGDDRAALAQEIVSVARGIGDDEQRAVGLLLHANALLEVGSPAYEASLESCLAIFDSLGQPQHRYTAATRRACVALLQGRLDDAEQLIEEAAALGVRIHEPDVDNVRMSQRLELVRARADSDELRQFATEAVEHWTGAPVHAYGVAAGFLARAGEVEGARRHLAAVVDLGTWRVDRSYLWSVFVRELAHAAIATDDQLLASELLADVLPLTSTCGVNGALVAFAGSHAHVAGLLAAAVGDSSSARPLLDDAIATYRRLGALGWADDVGAGPSPPEMASPAADATMRRLGALWQITFSGRDVSVPHSKGLADLARLLAAPSTDLHVLDLMGAVDRSGADGTVVDREALTAYRQRVADLDDDIAEAERNNDMERQARAESDRAAILDELGRVTGTRGKSRAFSNHPAERARKAVSGRIRDAIRKLDPVLPELAEHLERTVVTGTYCRYRADDIRWQVVDDC